MIDVPLKVLVPQPGVILDRSRGYIKILEKLETLIFSGKETFSFQFIGAGVKWQNL